MSDRNKILYFFCPHCKYRYRETYHNYLYWVDNNPKAQCWSCFNNFILYKDCVVWLIKDYTHDKNGIINEIETQYYDTEKERDKELELYKKVHR